MKYKDELSKVENILFIMVIMVTILMVGISMNYIAMESNDCRMPVLTNSILNLDTHFSFQDKEEVNNFYLVDIFNFPSRHYFFIGDVLMVFGFLGCTYNVLFFVTILNRRKK